MHAILSVADSVSVSVKGAVLEEGETQHLPQTVKSEYNGMSMAITLYVKMGKKRYA